MVNYNGKYEVILKGRVLHNFWEMLLCAHLHETNFVVDTLLGAELMAVSNIENLCRENVFSFIIGMSY